MEFSKFVFSGIFIQDNNSISALYTELDVASEGATTDEAKKNLFEAVSLYIETAVESNLPILRPVPEDENPLINFPDTVLEKFKLKINFTVQAYA
jgi:predicted RNase H-like HicB family nuclease